MVARAAALLLAALATATLAGCHALGRPDNALEVRSLNSDTTLKPAVRTACYRVVDDNTADIYLSDLPAARLEDAADDLTDAAGSILHIHFFLAPSPGDTPIDDTACNATLRQVIIAPAPAAGDKAGSPQAIGVYGGGGFFFPNGVIGDEVFGGSMRQGTHRLLAASPGFKDLLGPSSVSGRITASRDDALSGRIESRIERALRRLTPRPAPPAGAAPPPPAP